MLFDDGAGNGVDGDEPCTGGSTDGCDDNCPLSANTDQEDLNANGIGDVCDTVVLCPWDDAFPEHDLSTPNPAKWDLSLAGGLLHVEDHAVTCTYCSPGACSAPAMRSLGTMAQDFELTWTVELGLNGEIDVMLASDPDNLWLYVWRVMSMQDMGNYSLEFGPYWIFPVPPSIDLKFKKTGTTGELWHRAVGEIDWIDVGSQDRWEATISVFMVLRYTGQERLSSFTYLSGCGE